MSSSSGLEARSSSTLHLIPAVLPLAACLAGLLLLDSLILRLDAALGCLLGAALALFWASRQLDRLGPEDTPQKSATARILATAFLLRLLALPLAPTLSDDVYRYLWDGRVVASGSNPYLHPPNSPELLPLRDELWQRLPHGEIPTVYPPLALAAFALVSALPWPLLGWKLLLLAVDLIGCAFLCGLARQRGHPWSRVVLYAWNPLLIVEGVGMGHVDVLGVSAALAAVWALGRAAPVRAGLAAALGVATKLGPLLALPAWGRLARGASRFWLTAALVSAAALLPLFLLAGGVPPGLSTYAVRWEFNGPLFEPLWRLLDRLQLAPRLAALLDQVKVWSGHSFDETLNRLYPWVYPQLLAKIFLGIALLVVLWRSLTSSDAVSASRRVFGGALLCSATVYPWYLLWVLPWAALERHRGWLAVAALSVVSYLPQHRDLPLFPWFWLLLWLPGVILEVRNRREEAKACG